MKVSSIDKVSPLCVGGAGRGKSPTTFQSALAESDLARTLNPTPLGGG